MVRKINREIIFYGNYFHDFYFIQDLRIRVKIKHVLDLVRCLEIIPGNYLKHVRGHKNIYEIRISSTNRSIRLMSFFDKNDTVVILNCFTKKSRKIPLKEIVMAESLKNAYLNEKI